MPSNYLTELERNFYDKLIAANRPIPTASEPAWYFSVGFEQEDAAAPVGYLRRYEVGDDLRYPSAVTPVPGTIVGQVQIENGRATFDGNSYIEFPITELQVTELDKAKLDESMLSPKPLVMLGTGQVDAASMGGGNAALANPILFYQTGLIEFGLFASDGTIGSKINSEVLGASTAQTGAPGTYVWHAGVEQSYDPPQDGHRYRLAHQRVDMDSLEVVDRQEFYVQEAFQVPLRTNATFYVGGTPSGSVAPFRGWLREVIFDPAGGSGNSGGGTGKPSQF